MWMQKFKTLVLSTLPLLLMGCTRLEVAMNWADTFVMSEVSDYFNLSSVQKNQAKSEFNIVLADIQKNDFPIVAEVLERATVAVEKDQLSSEKILGFYAEIENAIKKAYQKFEPLAQKIVDTQAQSNFDLFDKEFEKKFRDDNEKFQKSENHFRDTIKKFNRWVEGSIGFLSEKQENDLREMLKSQPSPTDTQLKSRRMIFESFKKSRGDEKVRREIVHKLFADWESLQTAEYLTVRKAYHERIKGWVVGLAKDLSDIQKKNLIKNLKMRADELRKLSERKS